MTETLYLQTFATTSKCLNTLSFKHHALQFSLVLWLKLTPSNYFLHTLPYREHVVAALFIT